MTIDRSSVESVILETDVSPESLEDDAITRLLEDPDTHELGHGLLEIATRFFPGSSPEARQGFRGALIGAAFVVEVLKTNRSSEITG